MNEARFPNLQVSDHPLVAHKLRLLRDAATPPALFRSLVEELALLLAVEATRSLPSEEIEVRTPLEQTRGTRVDSERLVLVPILRAGLGMLPGVSRLVPGARIGHVGLFRDEESLEPVEYYFRIPPEPGACAFLLLDPMLATGGSAVRATEMLRERGAGSVSLLSLVAAPPGVEAMLRAHPEVRIHVGALDRELNEHGFILPGLGDAGDRLFGTL